MANISVLFEEKKFKTDEQEIVDYCFAGIRCTPEVAYRLCYALGSICGLEEVQICVQDEESSGSAILKIPQFGDEFLTEEDMDFGVEDNQEDNIGD